jgi:single-stranded-DNA-specific exonuclease
MQVAGLHDRDISSGHIGFALGPRINAMGRVGSPQKALDLLLKDDIDEAVELARTLDAENRNRQKIETRILDEALAKVEREVNFKHHRVIVLAGENWHPGVIGIVASRISDRFYRPAIMISLDGKHAKGSGRSIDGFHLFDYLARCKDTLIGFGGHEAACGVTLEKERVAEFRDRINEEAACIQDEGVFSPKIDIDMDVRLSDMNRSVISEIESLSPFGTENPRPVFSSMDLAVKDGPRKIGKNGFKMWVTDGKITCEAVSFGRKRIECGNLGKSASIAYTPSINSWMGVESIQLELQDLKIA